MFEPISEKRDPFEAEPVPSFDLSVALAIGFVLAAVAARWMPELILWLAR